MTPIPFRPITREMAAEILGVSIRTLRNYVLDGRMPTPLTLGKTRFLYWHPDVFYSWLQGALLQRQEELQVAHTAAENMKIAPVRIAKSKTASPMQESQHVVPPKSRSQRDSDPMKRMMQRSDAKLRRIQDGLQR